jgi:hypothetical protein
MESPSKRLNVSGVFPHLAVQADLGPPRTEMGVGGLMPWAGRLWMVTYVAHTRRSGGGSGLYEIDADLNRTRRPESRDGTYANRYIHFESNQLFIGPHVIDAERQVRTIEPLVDCRLTAVMDHLHDPEHKVYVLTMEGELFEVDVRTLAVTQLFDLVRELELPRGAQPHFKAGFTGQGRVIVANNTHDNNEFLGLRAAGRLAEWDGGAWRILERNPFYEVHGRRRMGGLIYAVGWDRASVILKTLVAGGWETYRLPKASMNYDHYWQDEWPRIREVEHERFLMDAHGQFYELSPHAWGGESAAQKEEREDFPTATADAGPGGRIWGVRPISRHLWVVSDFCNFRGMLVLGTNQVSPFNGDNVLAAEPDSGLWLGKTDDLWRYGKPAGWGGPWWDTEVAPGRPSDPFLMTGFEHKCLHVRHKADRTVRFAVEIDFLGDGSWAPYTELEVQRNGYVCHVFPQGFSAHWVRVTTNAACRATAHLTYT